MNVEFRKNRDIFPYLYSEIEKSKLSILAAVAWFTDPELLKLLLIKKHEENVEVKILLFNDEINLMLTQLKILGDSIHFSNILKTDYIMHHKFCIIDKRKVITGSYNWTIKARRFNRENIVCVEDDRIVNEFLAELANLLKNSQPQSLVNRSQSLAPIETVESLAIFNLEQAYNTEIERRIVALKELNLNIDTELAYDLIRKHTPVIAATRLATAENGKHIQSALVKLEEAGRLDLCFEESIIQHRFAALFNDQTRQSARFKLTQLNFFTNPIYQHLWQDYI